MKFLLKIIVIAFLLIPLRSHAAGFNSGFPNCFGETRPNCLLWYGSEFNQPAICSPETTAIPNYFMAFDKFGTRMPNTFANTVNWNYGCIMPNQLTASTSEFSYYYSNGAAHWCIVNINATLAQCQANDTMSFVRKYTFTLDRKNLYVFDSIKGYQGYATITFVPVINQSLFASAFMAPWLQYTIGSGFGVMNALMKFIVGLVVFSVVCYSMYAAFRFLKGKR